MLSNRRMTKINTFTTSFKQGFKFGSIPRKTDYSTENFPTNSIGPLKNFMLENSKKPIFKTLLKLTL
uniref:Uncharacterized protein n=1 Tax=Romanomermis culicivorax TaxID=13658 RepID=A0A915J9Q8_ROMCU